LPLPPGPRRLVQPDRQRARTGQIEGIEVDLGYAPVEPDRFVPDRQRQGDRDVGGDDAQLAAATATRVWQRQSTECMAAVLAADPRATPRSMSRRLHVGPENSSSAEAFRRSLEALRNSAQVP
jgi:hypothetical protein